MITEDEESAELIGVYEKEGVIRKSARLDLRHLAVATVNGIDAVVSWNFHDMVNIRTSLPIRFIMSLYFVRLLYIEIALDNILISL